MTKKFFVAACVGLLASSCTWAIEVGEMEARMSRLSRKIDVSLEHVRDHGYSGEISVDTLLGKRDTSRNRVVGAVSEIDTLKQLNEFKALAENYRNGSSADKYAGSVLTSALKQRELFLQMNGPKSPNGSFDFTPSGIPNEFLRPEEFITLDVPASEGVIYVTDKKWEERKANFEQILERHECDLFSQFTWEKGDDSHNYYIGCKQFVVDGLIEHYGGVAGNVFEISMELKSGGWLLGKKLEVTVPVSPEEKEKAGLGWYQAVVEANPFEYLYKTQLADMNKLGKIKDIAGEKTLLLKNARAKIWVYPKGADRSKSVYFINKKYGDLRLKGGK